MALSGLHIEYRYVGRPNRLGDDAVTDLSVYGILVSSETMALPGTSTATAPAGPSGRETMVTVKSSADAWISIGPTPADPALAATTRCLVYAGVPLDAFCVAGDKVRWAAA